MLKFRFPEPCPTLSLRIRSKNTSRDTSKLFFPPKLFSTFLVQLVLNKIWASNCQDHFLSKWKRIFLIFWLVPLSLRTQVAKISDLLLLLSPPKKLSNSKSLWKVEKVKILEDRVKPRSQRLSQRFANRCKLNDLGCFKEIIIQQFIVQIILVYKILVLSKDDFKDQ